jgi:hypothetical protein
MHVLRHRGARRLATLVLALSVAALPAVPASAEPELNGVSREKVDLAGATWITETDTTFTDVTVGVFDTTEHVREQGTEPWSSAGLRFVLFYWHLEYDPATGMVTETNYEGFDPLPGSTFQFDQSLRTGASASGTIQLSGWRCTYPSEGGFALPDRRTSMADGEATCSSLGSATVDLDLVWVGLGPIDRDVWRTMEGDPSHFRFHAQTVEAVRGADVTGRIGSEDLHLADGPATFGVLLSGAHVEHTLLNG